MNDVPMMRVNRPTRTRFGNYVMESVMEPVPQHMLDAAAAQDEEVLRAFEQSVDGYCESLVASTWSEVDEIVIREGAETKQRGESLDYILRAYVPTFGHNAIFSQEQLDNRKDRVNACLDRLERAAAGIGGKKGAAFRDRIDKSRAEVERMEVTDWSSAKTV